MIDYVERAWMLTGVTLPVKVLLGITVAAQVKALLLSSGAVGEGNMVVGNVVEEVDLVLLQEKSSSNGVDGSIAPSLVEEATITVQGFKVVNVGLASEPLEAADFKVGPLQVG